MNRTFKKHMDAIKSGNVTASNIIGLKKAINAAERRKHGYSVGMSSPQATAAEIEAANYAIRLLEPFVIGELAESGKRLLQSKRYAKRLEPVAAVVADLRSFRLVRFDWIDSTHVVPVYRAMSTRGSFLFRNIPWQTAFYQGLESGPIVL